jgi:hypothetical protein
MFAGVALSLPGGLLGPRLGSHAGACASAGGRGLT